MVPVRGTVPGQRSEWRSGSPDAPKDRDSCSYCPEKKNESIVINNDIVITVVEIRGDKVRLGIVAPKDVPVHREEVYEAIHGQKAPIAQRPAETNGT